MKRISLLASIAVAAITVHAQEDLTNHITIDRIIVPEARAATRINASPALLPVNTQGKRLNFAEYTAPSDITRGLMFTEPYGWGDSLQVTPWRGYASIGYFPIFNLGASVGYRVVDTRGTTLDTWLQYNGNSHKAKWAFPADDYRHDDDYRESAISLGLNFRHSLSAMSDISAYVAYTYYNVDQPNMSPDFSTGVNRLESALNWKGRSGDWCYGLGGSFGIFNFSDNGEYGPTVPAHETTGGIEGFFGRKLTETSRAAIDVEGTLLHYNNSNVFAPEATSGAMALARGGGVTRGLLTARPSYSLTTGAVAMRLGARVDMGMRSGKTFHIAPDVEVCFKPAAYVALYGKAGGGEHLNTLASLWDYSHYMYGELTYTNSHIPYTAELGVTIGRVEGFYIGIHGSYAKANEWLLPDVISDKWVTFTPVDVKGWKAGAEIGYAYRHLFRVRGTFDIAPDKADKMWYLWRDRARWVAGGEIVVTPIDRLSVRVGGELRSGRKCGVTSDGGSSAMVDLGDIANLALGGSYAVTPRLSVFLNLENLLNHHSWQVAGIPLRGIHGLAGANYKF